MSRFVYVFGIAVATTLVSTAKAEITLGAYRELREDSAERATINLYVEGTARGVFWANAMLGAKGEKRLFCMPSNLFLDDAIIESVVDQEIRAPLGGTPHPNDKPIELIVVRAFINRFPCE